MEGAGGTVIGPVPSSEQACQLVGREPMDGALLNVELRGGTSYPVALALHARRIPYLVVTGRERERVPLQMQQAPLLSKPVNDAELVEEAARAFAA